MNRSALGSLMVGLFIAWIAVVAYQVIDEYVYDEYVPTTSESDVGAIAKIRMDAEIDRERLARLNKIRVDPLAPYHVDVPPSDSVVSEGSKAVVPKPGWVDAIEGGSSHKSKHCLIELGGVLEVIRVVGLRTIEVEYEPVFSGQRGTPCISGTKFYISSSEFNAMNSQYRSIQDAALFEMDMVNKIVNKEHYGETFDVGKQRWVDVVNPEPIIDGRGVLTYGDTCSIGIMIEHEDEVIGNQGTIVERGVLGGKTLYEYRTDGNSAGSPCPAGVLFFEKNTQGDL